MSFYKLKLPRRGERFPPLRGGPLGFFEFAGWWARGVLWIDGWLTSATHDPLPVTLDLGDGPEALEAFRFCYSRPDLRDIPGAAGQILLLPVVEPASDPHVLRALHVEQAGEWYRWTPRQGGPLVADLVVRLSDKIPTFLPEIQSELQSFLREASGVELELDPETDSLFRRNAAAVDRLCPATESAILSPLDDAAVEDLPEAAGGEETEDPSLHRREDGAPPEPPPEASPPAAFTGEESSTRRIRRPIPDEDPALLPGGDVSEPAAANATHGAPDGESEEFGSEDEEDQDREDQDREDQDREDQDPEDQDPEEIPFEPLPPYSADPSSSLGLCIDRWIQIDPERFFVSGWFWDAENAAEALDLVSALPDFQLDLLEAAIFVGRRDVCEQYRPAFGSRADGDHGFVALVDDPVLEETPGYRLELRTRHGQEVRVGMTSRIAEPFAGRDELLGGLPERLSRDPSLLEKVLHPALERLQDRCRERARIARGFEFGNPPPSPSSSLIIPLFDRLDLMQHQLAQFADDPGMRDGELIYVLDSPAHELAFEKDAFHLSRLYGIPIRGLVLSRNVGHAAAVRLAAAAARGHRLVLMHSDVFAAGPGWLPKLEAYCEEHLGAGVLGPKLLYEDRSLQHAGLDLKRDQEHDGLWTVAPRFHGLPRHQPEADTARRVAAVSGACLMIGRELFEKVGGLRDVYVAGDLEDVDLCLRCADEGLESRYLPDVELYHLGGSSKISGPGWRRNAWSRLYNRWLLTRTWDSTIRELVEELDVIAA